MNPRESGSHRHSHLLIILLSVLIGAVVAALILAQPGGRQPVVQTTKVEAAEAAANFVPIAEKVLPAVVYITSETPRPTNSRDRQMQKQMEEFFKQFPFGFPFPEGPGEGSGGGGGSAPRMAAGSGWIYSEDGYIVTNAHVIRGASRVTVRLHDREGDAKDYPAKIVGTDPRSELAVVKIEAGRKLPILALGDSDQAPIASWVMAVGSPFGARLQQSVTVGVISAKGRDMPGETQTFNIGDLIQTDAPINPGNSGGPLVNLDGQVIGINVAIASPGATFVPFNVGIGFAIPSNAAKLVVPQLISKGQVARGWLGVEIKTLSDDNLKEYYGAPQGGVLVTNVNKNAPAAHQLQDEDVVTAVNGQAVHTAWDLQKAIADSAPGTKVQLDVIRGKQAKTVEVELGKLPAKYAGLDTEESKPVKADEGPAIEVQNITPDMAAQNELPRNKGVVIVSVGNDLADRLDAGDVILAVDGKSISNVDEYKAAIAAARKSHSKFVVLRVERALPDGTKNTDIVDVPLE